MLTDRTARSGTWPLALLSVVSAVVLSACGSDGGDAATSDAPAPPAPPESSVASGSSAVPDTSARPAPDPEPVPGVTGELIITRQRDLLDRGLINVQFQNDSELVMEMTDRQLVADHFATDPAPPRTSRIPNGRPVHLQVPYGMVSDCESAAPVEAALEFTYTTDTDGDPARGVVQLTGTELLDTIRAEQCAQLAVDDAYDVSFDAPVVDGERLTVDLVVEPIVDDAPPIEIERSNGTILVDATVSDTPLSIADSAVRTPVVFSVIRCDPHAMAEVTKRYGLELSVSIDGAERRAVDVDVTGLGDPLEQIVANCLTRTRSGS